MTFRILNAVLAGLFVVAAILQYNDPDPAVWIVIWTAAAVACITNGRHAGARRIAAGVGAVSLVWAGMLAPGVLPQLSVGALFQSMQAADQRIEQSREMLGLLLIAVWMGVLYVRGRVSGRPAPSGESADSSLA